MATGNASGPRPELSAQDRFFRYFQHEITALQEQMARLGDKALVGGERKDATDHCLAGITRLSSEVKDASGTIPAYDLRTYTEAIKALQDKLAETQASFAPKQKFAFKTRKNASAISLNDAAELAGQRQRNFQIFGPSNTNSNDSSFATTPIHTVTPPEPQVPEGPAAPASGLPLPPPPPPTGLEGPGEVRAAGGILELPGLTKSPTSTNISNRSSSHIIVPASAQHAHAPCQLSRLQSCCVDLSIPTSASAPFASLTINNIQSSLLLCGVISGPAHITGVKNSIIMISCRQFRMHECENVDIYLYCTSRPIIEDCKAIRFAEMPSFYTSLVHPSDPGQNLWSQIDDFKWLKVEQSPNWSTLSSSDQVPLSIWQDLIPGKPGWSIDEILQAVQIPNSIRK